jgi:hypothetical protein
VLYASKAAAQGAADAAVTGDACLAHAAAASGSAPQLKIMRQRRRGGG